MGQRQRIAATDDWQQLDLLVRFPEQHTYELIRPVVLFGYSPAERARLTGAPQRTLYRQAARFEREGMASLFGPPKVERHRTLPAQIQQAILVLKAEHPAFHDHEIATICGVQFGRRPSHNTVRRILAAYGVQLSPDLLLASHNDAHPTGLTDLRGARFASTIEVEQGRRLAEALVKMLTGGENVRARRMRQAFFEFVPTPKLHLAVTPSKPTGRHRRPALGGGTGRSDAGRAPAAGGLERAGRAGLRAAGGTRGARRRRARGRTA